MGENSVGGEAQEEDTDTEDTAAAAREQKRTPSHPEEPIVSMKKLEASLRCWVEVITLEMLMKKYGQDTTAAREEKDPKEAMVSMKKLIRCSVEILEQQHHTVGFFMVGREQKRTPGHPKEPIVFIQKFKASLRCSVEVITLEMLMKK